MLQFHPLCTDYSHPGKKSLDSIIEILLVSTYEMQGTTWQDFPEHAMERATLNSHTIITYNNILYMWYKRGGLEIQLREWEHGEYEEIQHMLYSHMKFGHGWEPGVP